MAEIVKMPKLSDTMTEGVVAAWHKKVGDTVSEGDILAEIETDKATMEFESFYDGTLLHIGVEKGKAAPVNDVLAIIGEKGEDVAALLASTETSDVPQTEESSTEATESPASVAESTPEEAYVVPEGITVIEMPKLSDTMTEGVVAAWHKKVGDAVSEGDILAEIETDKATMEFESFYDGTLLHIGVEKGNSAPVNDILAIIGEKGIDVSDVVKNFKSVSAAPAKEAAPSTPKAETPKAETPKTEVKTASKAEAISAPTNTNNERIFISPLAKKLAEERNINLNFVQGTGEGGRIVKRDIDNYNPASGGMASSTAHTSENYTEEPVSQMRKAISRSLSNSKFTAPHFYLTIEIDMDNAMEARKGINAKIAPAKISFNDMVIKATAKSLTEHSAVNSAFMGDTIRFNKHVNVGVAVAVPEGLLVPVVRYADGKSFSQISGEVRDFAQRAKAKKLQPEDWEGSTFTISNLGMFGIEQFTAIINSPNSCIMAVGAIVAKPVVKNGEIVPGNMMKVTLSCDHRTVDGAVGSAFLQTFKNYMENPITMLM